MACTKVFKYPKRMPCPPENIHTHTSTHTYESNRIEKKRKQNLISNHINNNERRRKIVWVRYKPVAKRTQIYAATETAT